MPTSGRRDYPTRHWLDDRCGRFHGIRIGSAGTIYGVTPYFLSILGIETTRNSNIVGGVVLTVLVCTVLIVGTRFAAWVNNAAVFVEVLCGIVAAVVLLIVALIRHPQPVSVLFQPAPGTEGQPYGYAFCWPSCLARSFTPAGSYPPTWPRRPRTRPTPQPATMLWSIGAVAASGIAMVIAFSYASPGWPRRSSRRRPPCRWWSTSSGIPWPRSTTRCCWSPSSPWHC